MKLSPMHFKDYVWPHNPRTYEISYQRDVAAHRVPFGAYILQGMGRQQRILRGSGEFVGPQAYQEFKKLATVFYDPTPGILIHPLWDTAKAWFVALRLEQEPTEDYVSYSFEFWECYDAYSDTLAELSDSSAAAAGKAQAQKTVYQACRGDTLLSVARANGVALETLVRLNPQIRNVNALRVGELIRIR